MRKGEQGRGFLNPFVLLRPLLPRLTVIAIAFAGAVFSTPVRAEWFSDDFYRPDSASIGNGWSDLNVNAPMSIFSGAAQLNQSAFGGVLRPFSSDGPITITATITQASGFEGLLNRYQDDIWIRNDGTTQQGYGLFFSRGDQTYDDSTVTLVDGGVELGSVESSFQFGAAITTLFTVQPNGAISGSVRDTADNFTFSFGPHVIQSTGSNVAFGLSGPDSRSATYTYPQLRMVTVTSPSQAPSPPPDYKQSSGSPWTTYRWEQDTLINDTNDTMHADGCFVTSAAIVADAFGHTVDPGVLNQFLRNYTAVGSGSFPWNVPLKANVFGEGDVGGPSLEFNRGTLLLPTKAPNDPATGRQQVIDALQEEINAHGSVILRVPFWATNGLAAYNASNPEVHAIVAYAVQGNSVLIRDPGHNYSTSTGEYTLDDYIAWFNSKVGAAGSLHDADGSGDGSDYSWLRYKPVSYAEPTSAAPEIVGAAHSPVEFVITDPIGRRLGYNPLTDTYYNEIPGSSYGRDDTPAPEDFATIPVLDGFADLSYAIGSPVAGQYSVSVYGLADGGWSLDGQMDGSPLFSLSGVAQAGSSDVRSFDVVSVPEPIEAALLFLGTVGYLMRRGWGSMIRRP